MDNHKKIFDDLISLSKNLTDEQFLYKSSMLFNASIGAHQRHIIEFYKCLFEGIDYDGIVCYENRERDIKIETNRAYSIEKMNEIIGFVDNFKTLQNEKIIMSENNDTHVLSSIGRELSYCLDHAIHHKALIKVGLKEQGLESLIKKDFGVAFSTIIHRNSQS